MIDFDVAILWLFMPGSLQMLQPLLTYPIQMPSLATVMCVDYNFDFPFDFAFLANIFFLVVTSCLVFTIIVNQYFVVLEC